MTERGNDAMLSGDYDPASLLKEQARALDAEEHRVLAQEPLDDPGDDYVVVPPDDDDVDDDDAHETLPSTPT